MSNTSFHSSKAEFVQLHKELCDHSTEENEDFLSVKERFNLLYKQLTTLNFLPKKHYTYFSYDSFEKFISYRLKECLTEKNPYSEIKYLQKVYDFYVKFKGCSNPISMLYKYSDNYKHFFYLDFLSKENFIVFDSNVNQKLVFLEQELYKRGIIIKLHRNSIIGTKGHFFEEDFEKKMQYIQNNGSEKESDSNNESKNRGELPFNIALLNEIGFFGLDKIKSLTKENQYHLLSRILDASLRQVKGNVLVLNPQSNENRIRYTSFLHEEEVKNYLLELHR